MPKVFVDYKYFTRDKNGNQKVDANYNYLNEIQKQLENNQKQK